MNKDYNRFKTAKARHTLSKPVQELKTKGFLKGRILDYGAGRGADTNILNAEGYNVTAYDKYNIKYNDDKLLQHTYNTVYCNYVFNVIPSLLECRELIQLLKTLSNNVYIAVRADNTEVKDSWKYDCINKGYWTSTATFQRFYNKEDIKKQFGDVETLQSNSKYILFKL